MIGKNRPIVTVSLLPKNWEEKAYRKLHMDIVLALKSVPELGIKDERDFFTLMPAELMDYGLGEEIVVQMRIPVHKTSGQLKGRIRAAVTEAIKRHLPDAEVECAIDMPILKPVS